MDYQEIRQRAVEFMTQRDWKRMLAKSHGYEQSLFNHSIYEVDALMGLLPILRMPQHFDLSEDEEKILIAAVVAHDVGKEIPEWQAYISGEGEWAPHVYEELTHNIVPQLLTVLEFAGLEEPVVEAGINFHMASTRAPGALMRAIFARHENRRWKVLADLVDVIDNFCSAQGVFGAKTCIERSMLNRHLKISYHLVNIRGVSTAFLHRAALDAHQEVGWQPLLHFSDASLYAASASNEIQPPTREMIAEKFDSILRDAFPEDIAQMMVGSPTATILPKPELFDYREARQYLDAAAQKIGRKSLSRKATSQQRRVVESYLKLVEGEKGQLSTERLQMIAERISNAQPDMMLFKFFKAMMSKEMVSEEGFELAKQKYEEIFGAGTFDELQSTSTLMPARDMALTVDKYYRLDGARFGLTVQQVEAAPPKERTEKLIEVLSQIAKEVYEAIPEPPSRDKLMQAMAEAFMGDLISPAPPLDLAQIAQKQLTAYLKSKPNAGRLSKKQARYFCPVCNIAFEEGTTAVADILDKPESHTNRGVAHGRFGRIVICNSCKYERFLRQLILKTKPAEVAVIFPRMNIGHASGSILLDKARELYENAYAFMIGNRENPDENVSLSFTNSIAQKLEEIDVFQLGAEELVQLFTYEASDINKRKHRRELEKKVKSEIGDTVEDINDAWMTDFPDWDAAIDALIANQIHDTEARQLRAEAYRLFPQFELVYQTPNMLLMPLNYPIAAGNDSDTNAALRKLYISLLIGITLDVSVAIVADRDAIDFSGGEGVAYVPPVPAVRNLIGCEWMPLSKAEFWLKAIGAASILSRFAAYPERSNLYQILTALTPGHVLRRLEMHGEGGVGLWHFKYLERLGNQY